MDVCPSITNTARIMETNDTICKDPEFLALTRKLSLKSCCCGACPSIALLGCGLTALLSYKPGKVLESFATSGILECLETYASPIDFATRTATMCWKGNC
jgi:hypothetical protein